MDNQEFEAFENRLRRFQPEEPPAHLRMRVLSRKSRFNRLQLILRIAAVILVFVAAAWNSILDAPPYAPSDSTSHSRFESEAYGRLGTLRLRIYSSYRIRLGLLGALKENGNMEVLH
jgi:hypothetical protein